MSLLYLVPAKSSSAFQDVASLALSGSPSYINAGNTMGFDSTGSYTFSAWVLVNTLATVQPIVAKVGSSPSFAGFGLNINNSGGIGVYLSNAAGTNQLRLASTATGIVQTGVWNHIAFSYNGGKTPASFVITLNGTVVAMTTVVNNLTGSSLNSADCTFGYDLSGPVYLNGNLDDISVFNGTALTALQLATIYNNGKPNNLAATANITNYFKFENSLADSVGVVSASAVGSPTYSASVPAYFSGSIGLANGTGVSAQVGTYSLGISFTSKQSGTVSSLIFYKNPLDTATSRQGRLYASGGGAALATFAFSGETASGLQTSAAGVGSTAILANTTYVIAVDFPNHYYQGGTAALTGYILSSLQGYFTAGTGNFPSTAFAQNLRVDLNFTNP